MDIRVDVVQEPLEVFTAQLLPELPSVRHVSVGFLETKTQPANDVTALHSLTKDTLGSLQPMTLTERERERERETINCQTHYEGNCDIAAAKAI